MNILELNLSEFQLYAVKNVYDWYVSGKITYKTYLDIVYADIVENRLCPV